MKKSRKSTKSPKKSQTAAPVVTTRRSFLAKAPYIVGGIVAVGGIGLLGVNKVRADLAEQDLSIVGSGMPVIVQVHDPSCPICLALQKEARAAMETVDNSELEYRVASIASDVGSAFADRHNSAHATLLFFDADGAITQRVHAPSDRDTLQAAFQAHISANK